MLEKEIEKQVCDYARKRGFLVYKFSSPGRVSVPDRIFISPDGRVIFIEFKAQGKKPTKGQMREMEKLKAQCCYVDWLDNVDRGKEIVDAFSR